jgi:hypothetical protein
MHRATRGSGLTTDSADGSMAKDTAVALDHDGAATSALTECAFSWKFAGEASKDNCAGWGMQPSVKGCYAIAVA